MATAEADPSGMTNKKGNYNCPSHGNGRSRFPSGMMSKKDDGNGDSDGLDGVFDGAFGGQRDHEARESAEEHA
jgi:hypothetical protein